MGHLPEGTGPVRLDGAMGEGGGQILRSALALSLITGRAFNIERIRAGRKRPGLLRQHLTCVQAALDVCAGSAAAEGAVPGSTSLSFTPGTVCAGNYQFAIGTAGSTGLVLQTVLIPLALVPASSTITLEGGTHNPASPPFDFLERVFLPALARMGLHAEAVLLRAGFYPAGGGRLRVFIAGGARLVPVEVHERNGTTVRSARAVVSIVPVGVAQRELAQVREELNWSVDECFAESIDDPRGPGNVLHLEVSGEGWRELVTAFGEKGTPAESVAATACRDLKKFLASGAPVGEHLADQLLLPLALAGGGGFTAQHLTPHARTNMEVIRAFLPVRFFETQLESGAVRVSVTAEGLPEE